MSSRDAITLSLCAHGCRVQPNSAVLDGYDILFQAVDQQGLAGR
jgi:hypothetical protein